MTMATMLRSFTLVVPAVILLTPLVYPQDDTTREQFIDIGSPGDDDVIGPGIYQREGPVENMGPVFDATFRWCQDRFTLNLPVFAGRANLVSIRMRPHAGDELLVEAADRPVAIVRSQGDHQLQFLVPGSVVGDSEFLPVTLTAPVVLGPASERDPRILYGPLNWVRVRLVEAPGLGAEATAISVKIGDPGDEMFLVGGFYHPEGPYEKYGDFFRDTFRWAQPGFVLGLPVFPRSANTIVLRASISGDDTNVSVADGDRPVGVLSPSGENAYTISLPAEDIGERNWIVLSFSPGLGFESANPQDSRQLFCALNGVTILGEGDGAQVPVLLPPTYSLKAASYHARYLGVSGGSTAIALCPRIGFSREAGAKMPAHLRQEAGVVLANGCAPVLWGYAEASAPVQRVLDEFVKPRRQAFAETTSLPYVALIEPSAHRLASGGRAGLGSGPPGALLYVVEFLNRLHYPCDVISDRVELDELQRYALVVVPSLAWYADDLWPKLRAYVEVGGALLATGSASVSRNETDERSFALADVYGVRMADGPQRAGLLPTSGYFTDIGAAHVVEVITAEQLLPLCSTDRPEKETLRAPGVTVNRFGKGRAVYIAGPIFGRAAARTDPLAVPVVQQAMEAVLPEPLIEFEDAENVEIALRQNGPMLYVHLANRTQPMDFGGHPAYVEETLPVGPITIRLHMDEEPTSVKFIPGGHRADAEWRAGVLTVMVPSVDVHAAVAIRRG